MPQREYGRSREVGGATGRRMQQQTDGMGTENGKENEGRRSVDGQTPESKTALRGSVPTEDTNTGPTAADAKYPGGLSEAENAALTLPFRPAVEYDGVIMLTDGTAVLIRCVNETLPDDVRRRMIEINRTAALRRIRQQENAVAVVPTQEAPKEPITPMAPTGREPQRGRGGLSG